MARWTPCLLFAAACGCSTVRPGPGPLAGVTPGRSPGPEAVADGDDEEEVDGVGFAHAALLYFPNRIFDLLDVVRARVMVGPGLAVGARATELADVYVGGHSSVFAGIPGPRRERDINWPAGLESKTGVEISTLDATAEMGVGPDYGLAEFGATLHAVVVGVDVGVDPLELVDLVVGLGFFDLMDDDL